MSAEALRTIAGGVAVLDAEGRVLDLDATAQAMLGHPLVAAAGRELRLLGLPVPWPCPGSCDCIAIRADGTTFAAEVALAPIPGERVRYVAYIRDVAAERLRAAGVLGLPSSITRFRSDN